MGMDQKTLTGLGLWEKEDLEAMFSNSFEELCKELDLKILLVGKQFYVCDEVRDHGDLLALNKDGHAVIIELKRKYDDNQLYQSLTYASMISDWDLTGFSKELARFKSFTLEEATEEITAFLDIESDQINGKQLVYLLAEDFDYQTLVTAKWLREKHDVEVSCIRMDISGDGDDLFLSCSMVYPTPMLQEHAINIRQRNDNHWSCWKEALDVVENQAVADFFRHEIADNREGNAANARLYFRIGGKRRFNVNLRTKNAYVWQSERFLNDQAFLKQLLGPSAGVEVVGGGRSLRFRLETHEQFAAFKRAAEEQILADWFTQPEQGE